MHNSTEERRHKSMRTEVVIVQFCVPHYRVPFFAELSQRMSGNLTVIAGSHSFHGSPVSAPTIPELNRIEVRNFFLANQLAFQQLPSQAWNASIAVLEFSPRILSNLWLLLRRKRLNRPVVLWGHGLSRRRNSPAWIKRMRRWMAIQADALIFYDERGRQDFLQLGLPPDKLFVANNSIDAKRIQTLATQYRAVRKDILFIGRLIPEKKVTLLIEGFARAHGRLPEGTRLVIVGDGPERGGLVSLVQSLQIPELVEFVGEITDDEELAPYFAQSVVSVSPGCVGLSAIHSLAYGVPLLVADNEPHGPEIEVLLPGQTGEYFPANDPDALADRLVELLANPRYLDRLGSQGQALVQKKYSVQHMADVFLQAFKFVLKEAN